MEFDFMVAANPVWESAWLVEDLPGESGMEPAGPVVHDGGGSALNTACALATAGHQVLAVGRVGDDAAGHAAVEALRRRGVTVRIEVVRHRVTKRNHLFVERSTQATAFQVFIPADRVDPWEEMFPGLASARVFLLDRLAAAASDWLYARRGVPGAWNALCLNSGRSTPEQAARFRGALPSLRYLQIPEEDVSGIEPALGGSEAAAGSGERAGGEPGAADTDRSRHDPRRLHRPRPCAPLSPREVGEILAAGVEFLVRTRGAGGVVLHVSGGDAPGSREIRIPASGEFRIPGSREFPMTAAREFRIPAAATKVIDPTGAGDAFAAGFIDGLLRNVGPEQAARQGVDWAARACRYLGARGWLDEEPPETI